MLGGSTGRAGVTKSEAAATALLNSSNVMRTRYAHQITVAVLDCLMNRSHTQSGSDLSIDAWIAGDARENPTMLFWMLIQKYEILIFMFIRTHRERKFALYWIPCGISYLYSLPWITITMSGGLLCSYVIWNPFHRLFKRNLIRTTGQ